MTKYVKRKELPHHHVAYTHVRFMSDSFLPFTVKLLTIIHLLAKQLLLVNMILVTKRGKCMTFNVLLELRYFDLTLMFIIGALN